MKCGIANAQPCRITTKLCLLVVGCATLFAASCTSLNLGAGKKAKQDALPPGIVTPQQKREKWKALVESAKEGNSAEVSRELTREFKSEEDPFLRAELLRIAERLPPHAILPLVSDGLEDPHPDVRTAACRLAGQAKLSAVLGKLTALAEKDAEGDVRKAAVKALGEFQDPQALAVLGKSLRERDPALQYLAIRSLKQATGKDFGYDIAKWQSYLNGQLGGATEGPVLAGREGRQY